MTHPNNTRLWLSHIRQLRMMIREGRQVHSARFCIRSAQIELAIIRAARPQPDPNRDARGNWIGNVANENGWSA